MSNNQEEGQVTGLLPDVKFRVKLDSGKEVLCYLAGKMKIYNIKVVVGDFVRVEVDPYGGKCTNRIVRRV